MKPRIIRAKGVGLVVAPTDPSTEFEERWWALLSDRSQNNEDGPSAQNAEAVEEAQDDQPSSPTP